MLWHHPHTRLETVSLVTASIQNFSHGLSQRHAGRVKGIWCQAHLEDAPGKPPTRLHCLTPVPLPLLSLLCPPTVMNHSCEPVSQNNWSECPWPCPGSTNAPPALQSSSRMAVEALATLLHTGANLQAPWAAVCQHLASHADSPAGGAVVNRSLCVGTSSPMQVLRGGNFMM